jgi:multiple sugar transport system ATP-binding protein
VHTENLGADSYIYVDVGTGEPVNVRAPGKASFAPGTKLGLAPIESNIHRFGADGKPLAS